MLESNVFSSPASVLPGRTVESLMEAPEPSDTVELIAASAHHSRPGPVVSCGLGVFHPVTSGEYCHHSINGPTVPGDSIFSTSERSLTHGLANDDEILIYFQNAGGMNSSTGDYLLATSDDCYDVIVLNETWLDSRTLSSQVFGPGYEVFRCDRGPRNSRKSIGGGVLVAVNKKRKSRIIENDLWDSVEQVWVCIELIDRKVFLCGVYVPPDRTRDDDLIETHTRSVMSVIDMAAARNEILIIGDFNLSGIAWQSSQNGFLHPDPDRSIVQLHCAKSTM